MKKIIHHGLASEVERLKKENKYLRFLLFDETKLLREENAYLRGLDGVYCAGCDKAVECDKYFNALNKCFIKRYVDGDKDSEDRDF